MLYALVFEKKQIINKVINSNVINVERVFGYLLDIRGLEPQFNILPQFASAVEKLESGKSSGSVKSRADLLYGQDAMFAEWRIKYLEYLCMLLLEMRDEKKQKAILKNYLRLVRTHTSGGFWEPKNTEELTAENFLKIAFDDAAVKIQITKLSTDLADTAVTAAYYSDRISLSNKIILWFRNDFNKKYRWER